MLKKILIGLGFVVLLLVGFISMQPSAYRIERSITIAAPPALVFDWVNDFHRWNDWSPWDKLDPNIKRTYEGPAAGVGTMYSWAGDNKVGEGRMTLIDSRPPEKIDIKLEFFKPWESVATTEFTFAAAATGTTVTWAMNGTNNFAGKACSLFMNMDKMVGGSFEEGLAKLKELSEAQAAAEAQKAAEVPPAAAEPAPEAAPQPSPNK